MCFGTLCNTADVTFPYAFGRFRVTVAVTEVTLVQWFTVLATGNKKAAGETRLFRALLLFFCALPQVSALFGMSRQTACYSYWWPPGRSFETIVGGDCCCYESRNDRRFIIFISAPSCTPDNWPLLFLLMDSCSIVYIERLPCQKCKVV